MNVTDDVLYGNGAQMTATDQGARSAFEAYIRAVVAHEIACKLKLGGEEAALTALAEARKAFVAMIEPPRL